jgi:hypothetical protein
LKDELDEIECGKRRGKEEDLHDDIVHGRKVPKKIQVTTREDNTVELLRFERNTFREGQNEKKIFQRVFINEPLHERLVYIFHSKRNRLSKWMKSADKRKMLKIISPALFPLAFLSLTAFVWY